MAGSVAFPNVLLQRDLEGTEFSLTLLDDLKLLRHQRADLAARQALGL